MPGNASSFDLGLSSGGLISGLNYTGKTSGLLNQATSRLGLSWHFDPELQGVRITYFDTRTFDVWTFGDELEIESTVKSGLLTSTGSGDSGSTTSSGGAKGESGSNQSTKSKYKTSLMSGIVQWMTNSSTIGGIDNALVMAVVGHRLFGLPFAVYSVICFVVALALPKVAAATSRKTTHALALEFSSLASLREHAVEG